MPEKKPKLELELNKPVKIELMQDQALIGTSRYGEYYLYSVRNGNGHEYSFFPDKEVHEKLKALKRGDIIEICKRAEQKGNNKIVTTFDVKVLNNHSTSSSSVQSNKDNYFQTMLSSYQDAQKIQEELNGMVDVNRIAITLFIARSKISPNGYN